MVKRAAASIISRLDERGLYTLICAGLSLILIVPIWSNSLLPMQDYPQHLFMAWVSSSYADPQWGWQENFELRPSFGPYRIALLAQMLLGNIFGFIPGAQIIATLYVLLIAVLVRHSTLESDSAVRWGSLIFFPLCLHPMYFYGFMNFTFSIPILIFLLIGLRKLLSNGTSIKLLLGHCSLVVLLFLLHPYTLLVYIVYGVLSVFILARERQQYLNGLYAVLFALTLFLSWILLTSNNNTTFDPSALRLKWWPQQWNLQFLAMMFTGMRITDGPYLLITALWLTSLVLLASRLRSASRVMVWLGALLAATLAGYFVLPFSIQTDARFSFFGVRMAAIAFFVFGLLAAQIRLGNLAAFALVISCITLTSHSAVLYGKVAREVESILPIIAKMEARATVLPLITSSRSEHLDPTFYAQFHYSAPFYYHVVRGGGRNPDLFSNRLMPVVFREGRRPARPGQRELQRWPRYAADYDYIITRQIPERVMLQPPRRVSFIEQSGPWRLYRTTQ